MGILCAAGSSAQQVKENLNSGINNLTYSDAYHPNKEFPLAMVNDVLPEMPLIDKKWHSRNNRMALAVLQQIRPQVNLSLIHI